MSCRHVGSWIIFEFSAVGARLTLVAVRWASFICFLSASDQRASLSDSSESRVSLTWHKIRLPGATWAMSRCCKRMSWRAACRIAPSISRTSGWSWSTCRAQRRCSRNWLTWYDPEEIVAVEEIDNASWVCQPPHPSWDKLLQTFHAAFRASGGNVLIGRRLPELLRAAGLEDVQYKVHVDVAMPGGYRRTHLLTLINSLRGQITRLDLLTEHELVRHRQALATHLDDANTVVIDKLLVQAWGRKPS